jgi:hypothetical protein
MFTSAKCLFVNQYLDFIAIYTFVWQPAVLEGWSTRDKKKYSKIFDQQSNTYLCRPFVFPFTQYTFTQAADIESCSSSCVWCKKGKALFCPMLSDIRKGTVLFGGFLSSYACLYKNNIKVKINVEQW